MKRFIGKVVVITGAGSGIGAATAKRLYDEGAFLVLSGRSKERLENSATSFEPDRVQIAPADASDQISTQELVKSAINRFGRIDTLVNNAGIGWEGSITDDTAVEDWRRVFSINADGVFHVTRAALPHLMASRGSIVNVSSVAGLRGDWGMSIYNASKGAVSNFTRALALDMGAKGVRVNAVCPTYIETEMTQFVTDRPALVARFAERIPLKRGGRPEEVASAIAFLASEDARFITGVNLPVDGGVTASSGQPNFLEGVPS